MKPYFKAVFENLRKLFEKYSLLMENEDFLQKGEHYWITIVTSGSSAGHALTTVLTFRHDFVRKVFIAL